MYVNIANADKHGDPEYKNLLEKMEKDGLCPLCPEQIRVSHEQPTIREGNFWLITYNKYPYANTKFHFLLVLKSHKENTLELTKDEWSELHEHINWITKEYKIPGGTYMMRCGDTNHTGATINHLHSHFICPDFEDKNREPIVVKL
jgi:diadenosine tetraphosphate (Ap4A) HIT family hydrolase